ncbi:hypothetical protein OPQ81_002074 [Rhizoctonia solani]|nr:hypothetical protein OPQ81_002074 [Rhizoctonia solani]
MCLIFYGANKALVYLCLTERVRAVWSTKGQRLRSPIYLFCLSLLLPLAAMLVGVMIPQAVHYVYNGYCVIGVSRLSYIFLPIYDFFINLFLTGMFVVPLVRATIRSAWVRTVAIRSTIASLMALTTTLTNGIIIYVLNGNETIWVCFGSCAADVVINALILYWAMQGPGEGSTPRVKSAYFSPIGNIPTFQPDTSRQHHHRSSIARQHRAFSLIAENASDTTVAALGARAPSLEKPRPTMQNPRQHAFVLEYPSRKRLSLPLATEMHLSFREKPGTYSRRMNEPDSVCPVHLGNEISHA